MQDDADDVIRYILSQDDLRPEYGPQQPMCNADGPLLPHSGEGSNITC
jgi:hypothetical protein